MHFQASVILLRDIKQTAMARLPSEGREQCLDREGQSHCNKPSQGSTLLAGCSRAHCSLSVSRHKETLQILWGQIGKKQGEKGSGASVVKCLPRSA